ncbi:GNAT family N-acetyltransferase [Methylophaga sp. OBS3]|uniref:GNAT family N-acetyltransferase n=1 Tax=Methylophaga sp. OBS3 TaxID=2991934 RepID=UPI00224F77F0|nr:GNAT family N-acetyltransferase [Methylophaga sp. OBS3]MCX4189396.1 GNAT family N-acetyltransferase [Methylophaga sp. OBS3]
MTETQHLTLVPELATDKDIDDLHYLLNFCAKSMADQGMQHWLGVYSLQAVNDNLQHKSVYKLSFEEQLVACVALSQSPATYYKDCWPDAPRADYYLTMLAVVPNYQQHGFGKQLVQFCQSLVPHGKSLQLDAVAHYPALLNFYRKLGFEQINQGIGLGDKRYLFQWLA